MAAGSLFAVSRFLSPRPVVSSSSHSGSKCTCTSIFLAQVRVHPCRWKRLRKAVSLWHAPVPPILLHLLERIHPPPIAAQINTPPALFKLFPTLTHPPCTLALDILTPVCIGGSRNDHQHPKFSGLPIGVPGSCIVTKCSLVFL